MIDRVMKILEVFRTAGSPLTASEIARRTGIPMASTHRLVGELVRNGVLVRDEQRRLSIGMRLWEITARSSTVRHLRESALPHMEDVLRATQAPTLLCVLDGRDVVNLETLSPRGPSAANITQPGARLTALGSSPGIVLLAFADERTREDVTENAKLVRFTSHTPVDRSRIRRLIAQAGAEGHVVAPRWMWTNSTGIAVPIRDREGRASAALSVTVPADSPDPASLLPLLKAAARGIAHAQRSVGTDRDADDPDLALLKFHVKRATDGR